MTRPEPVDGFMHGLSDQAEPWRRRTAAPSRHSHRGGRLYLPIFCATPTRSARRERFDIVTGAGLYFGLLDRT